MNLQEALSKLKAMDQTRTLDEVMGIGDNKLCPLVALDICLFLMDEDIAEECDDVRDWSLQKVVSWLEYLLSPARFTSAA
jgi:hypothetical protein